MIKKLLLNKTRDEERDRMRIWWIQLWIKVALVIIAMGAAVVSFLPA